MQGAVSLAGFSSDAPIGERGASPLRVATGGNANWSSESVAAARPPSPIGGATTRVLLCKPRVLGAARLTREWCQPESHFVPPQQSHFVPAPTGKSLTGKT